MNAAREMLAACACGNVELKATGEPIVSSICYCKDCQKGASQIEALPNAGKVNDADGGTAYILYRKDRIACTKGSELLKGYKIKDSSPTNRMVASCCNTAIFVGFDRGPFWISAYRARFRGELPPVQMRVCTKSKREGVVLPRDVPAYPGFPLSFVGKLLMTRIAMALGR
jgi:hypothetical protein